jgi:predicted dehydrogenase
LAPLRLAVIGCGYWGPNLVRTFVEIPETVVVAVADRDPTRFDSIRRRYPQIELLTADYYDIFERGLDAVVVSTPPQTHFEIVRACLSYGLDVLVEKPLATSSDHAVELVESARMRDRILMVGHIAAYNPAVQALKEMIDSGELGEIAYIDAVRGGLGLFHPSLNVVWDLAPHDVSILMYLLGQSPRSVSARGIACVEESIEDVAYISLTFPSGVLAHIRLSWLDPCKSRRITVVGKEKMAVYDDLETHEKLKIYDKRVDAIRRTDTFGDYQFAYHYGSVVSPYIHHDEPLRLECLHFVECVFDHKQPLTDGENGLRVVRVIEAAQRSLRQGGAEMPVSSTIDQPLSAGNGQDGRDGAPVTTLRPEALAELVVSPPSGNGEPTSNNQHHHTPAAEA